LGFFSWRSGFVYDGVIPLALVEGGSALVDFTLAIDDIHTTASTTFFFFFSYLFTTIIHGPLRRLHCCNHHDLVTCIFLAL
jgi:hypothetical protein